jgi:hypothetical protein
MTVRTVAHAAVVGEGIAAVKVGIAAAVVDGSPLAEAGHSVDDQVVLDRMAEVEDMSLELLMEGNQAVYRP